MYQYKFLEIKSKMGVSSPSYFKGFEEIIEKQASEGWRFVTTIPVESRGMQGITTLSLVFEKKTEE